jgi:hypothetical protein
MKYYKTNFSTTSGEVYHEYYRREYRHRRFDYYTPTSSHPWLTSGWTWKEYTTKVCHKDQVFVEVSELEILIELGKEALTDTTSL